MDALDQIPWKDLTHAYGSAADVPQLLRSLRSAPAALKGEDSPLWQLFGNIWHQGTVYEATAYAVPFLIELAADPHTPDRVGILSLLAEIASGTSYLDVHGNLLDDPDFERKKSEELSWVQQAQDAVAAGFATLMDLTHERGDLGCAAVHVLVQLRRQGAEVAAAIRRLLRDEVRISNRAGLLLSLSSTGDAAEETLAVLSDALNAEGAERQAAAYAFARIPVPSLPAEACEAVMEAISGEDLEVSLQDLPWNAVGGLDPNALFARLDAAHQDRVVDGLITSLEAGDASDHGVAVLVNLLFPIGAGGRASNVTPQGMTNAQRRAVRALYAAMKDGERIFYGHFPCWGLPDSLREWRKLALECA